MKGGIALSSPNTIISDTKVRNKLIHSFLNSEIYFIPTRKYKTNTITFFFIDDLRKETVSKNAMIPAILRRGCSKYPDMNTISLQLENLYGASFDCGVLKKGEFHILFFYVEYISDNYIPDKIKNNNYQDLFQNCIDLLISIITDPIIENEGFKPEFLAQEKENLKRLIEGRINDKVTYSVERCFEEMTRDEPYSIYQFGDIQGLEEIDENNLYEHYKRILYEYPLKVFISGSISDYNIDYLKNILVEKRSKSPGNITNKVSKKHSISRNHNNNEHIFENVFENGYQNIENQEIRKVKEVFDITQAKLSVGFRTNVYPDDKDYYALFVCTGILDGDMNSKLFKNIREKAGLAYYIFSQFEKFKGLLLVSCGIDAQNKDKTVELILKQIDALKSGDISETEYKSALKSIGNAINSLKDDQLQVIDFYLGQLLSKTQDDFDTLLEKVNSISVNDIIEVAKKIKPELIYLLSPE